MADRLLIILANTDPRDPAALGSPFNQATSAAAMEYDVEVVLTGRTGELAMKGVAAQIEVRKDMGRTVYDLIKEAHEAGVRFKACVPVDQAANGALIPEVEDTVGGAYIISEAMDEDTVILTY
jgi:predicted peroxiredoxin